MAQIFLSYVRDDEKKVKAIYKRLSDVGFQPWMDVEDLYPGERWEFRIKAAIRHSDFFLVCLSKRSVHTRSFLQKEIRNALELWQEKLEDDIYLIPARLEECEIPELLSGFLWVDLFTDEGWTRLIQALQEGIKRRSEGTAGSVSFKSFSIQNTPFPDREIVIPKPTSLPPNETYASTNHALVRLGAKSYAFRREPLTSEIISRIRQGPLPIVLHGLAGIGKTTLLCEISRELRVEFPWALVIIFNGPAALELAYVLEEINAFLTALGRGIELEQLRAQDMRRTFEVLITRLADLRLLVLLDAVDAAPVAWLDILLQGFAAVPQARILATAQNRPVSSLRPHVHSIPPLSV